MVRTIGNLAAMDPETRERWRLRLTALWGNHIPLAGAMGVSIARLDGEALEIRAPLNLNANHMGTAFGGALQALATLAGWGVAMMLAGPRFDGHVVIGRSHMRFLAPVPGTLHARCRFPPPAEQAELASALAARGRARIDLVVVIGTMDNGALPEQARFEGRFVALGQPENGAAAT